MSAQDAERLSKALEGTGLAESVNSSFGNDRVSVLLRVKNGVDAKWNDVIRNLLLATEHFSKEAHAWSSHVCRVYFLKEVKGEKKLVFGWNVSITSQELGHSLTEVIRVLNGGDPEPRPENSNEVSEFPLVGVRGERNVPGSAGKGAYTVGGKGSFRPPVR